MTAVFRVGPSDCRFLLSRIHPGAGAGVGTGAGAGAGAGTGTEADAGAAIDVGGFVVDIAVAAAAAAADDVSAVPAGALGPRSAMPVADIVMGYSSDDTCA